MREFFLENRAMKLVSLFLAATLWLVLRGERRTELALDVPVQVRNLPASLVVTSELEPTVNLRLVGPKTQLARIDPTTFPAYGLDLREVRKGSNSIWVHEHDFRLPSRVQIARIVPQVIRVTVEPAEEKLVRVEPRFADEPDEGFEIETFEVTPPLAKKRGSRRELASTPYVFTEPISLAGRRGDFVAEAALAARPEEGLSEERRVTVKVTIREKEITKLFREVPVRVKGFASAVRVEPRTVSIRARGRAGKVLALAEEPLHVDIDVKEIGAAKLRQKTFLVRPTLPKRPGLELAVVPATLRLTLLAE